MLSHGAYSPGGLQLIRECGNKCRQACYLLLSHYPPLLRARREIIPSCSSVTKTMEGGVSSHGASRPGGSPTPGERGEAILSPFRWLDVVLSLPSHQVRRCGEIGGGRYVTVGLLLGRAAVSWLFWFSGPGEECSRAV